MILPKKDSFRVCWTAALTVLLIAVPALAGAMEDKLNRFTLSNGLRVLVIEEHERKVAAIQIWVTVGSADEEEHERGISHLIEHMAFKGTNTRGVGRIASEVEALGGDVNAYTSWDETVFHITIPSQAVDKGLDILVDAVFNPVIDPEELAREKQVVLEEILERDERPDRKSSELLFRTAYIMSPYGFPVIGNKECVSKITREDILAFRMKWYVPDNMFLLIVGDVDAAKIRDEIERLTAGIERVAFFRPPRPVEPYQREIRSALVRDENAREARLHIAFHIPAIRDADVNALDLAGDILGARDTSRLVRVLKKEKRLVNEISAVSLTPKHSGLFVVSATLVSANLEAATRAIMEELEALGRTPPSNGELSRAKTAIESEHLYARETVDGIARSMGSFEADLGDALYEMKYLKLNSAVTPDEISHVVRRYLAPPHVTITALIPKTDAPELGIESLREIVRSFDAAKEEGAAVEAAEGVFVRTLANGIRVVLAPDDANPLVSFRLACLGGKRFETRETQGIMNFVAEMLTKGAGRMDEVEIGRKIEDMGGRLHGFSGYDSFGLAISFFSRHISDGLRLLFEVYSSPTFPEDKMDRERNLIINRIRTEPDRPASFAVTKLHEVLFTQHPYGFDTLGTVETVSGLTAGDLRETYAAFAVPSNTVICGVGEMDPRRTMAIIAELFGKQEPRRMESVVVPPAEPLEGIREKTIRIPRAKCHLLVGFRGTTLTDEHRYALAVLKNVLAGQGGRLFLQLRDRESLAYIVTPFSRTGLDPGTLAFYIACDTPKVDQAVESLFREITRIRETPVSDEELRRSINNLIGNHRISLQSSWSRAENTALNTLYDLGYDYDSVYLKKISEVTADQVLQAAARFLDPDRHVIVKILPEKPNR